VVYADGGNILGGSVHAIKKNTTTYFTLYKSPSQCVRIFLKCVPQK
jgi:hypothetical protein